MWECNDDFDAVRKRLIEDGYEETDVVFNRDGWYYDRPNKCWYEFNGTAWQAEKTAFLYELQSIDTVRLSENEIKAIKTLFVYRTLPPNVEKMLGTMLYRHNHKKMVRDTYLNSAKYRIQLFGR